MTEPSLVSDDRPPRRLAHFQVTKQHRRFVEFADAVRRLRDINDFRNITIDLITAARQTLVVGAQ